MDAAVVQPDEKQHAEVKFEANQSQTRACLLTASMGQLLPHTVTPPPQSVPTCWQRGTCLTGTGGSWEMGPRCYKAERLIGFFTFN